jgi:hypothetical protein
MAIFNSLINPTEGTSRFMCTVAFKYVDGGAHFQSYT